MPKLPKISIIVVTFNALDFIKQCIASVKRYSNNNELIIVDNGSQDMTVKWLKKQKFAKVVFNPNNSGFAAANNQGIRMASGENILLLNSDVIVTAQWLERLMACFEKDRNVGICGPYSNYVRGDQRIPISYSSLAEMQRFARNFNCREKETYHISGFCMMIKRKILDAIGLFDERFKIGNFEDVDYCLRAMKAGFKLKVANCFMHHFGSRSFIDNADTLDGQQAYKTNYEILARKWPRTDIKKAIPV